MSEASASFDFRTFAPTGEGRLSLKVSEELLRSQEHTAPIRESIETHLAEENPTWRMRLTIENTQPFDVDFARLGRAAAVVRILRGDFDTILIIVADAAGDVDIRSMRTIEGTIQQLTGGREFAGVFDWITGTPPPLAGLVYLTGKPNNGLDMLGMCLAEGFLRRNCPPISGEETAKES